MPSVLDFLDMGIFADFLENSSICGLAHISRSKTTIERGYWIGISALMIAGTIYLTMDAFYEWDEKPISTVTKVKPMYDIKFHKIIVCPPKVSFSFILSQCKIFFRKKTLPRTVYQVFYCQAQPQVNSN